MTFQNRTAIVTGASRGIGRAICLELAGQGCNIAFSYSRSTAQAADLTETLQRLGIKVKAYQTDVSDFDAVNGMVQDVKDEFGRIDYLVNNAGITRDKLILRMSEQDWDDVLDANLKGAFNYCRAVVHYMLRAKSGSILNMSSISGVVGMPGQANYSASKAGMIGLTKALAKEVASRGITVNALALGMIETEMTQVLAPEYRDRILSAIPLGRFGSAQEVARIALFILSPESGYITGQVIQVDGGLAM